MKVKRWVSYILTAAMSVSLAACSSSGGASDSGSAAAQTGEAAASSEDHETFKIAVLEVQLNDESTNRAEYFNDYIGPKYNCEFMFSEACDDLDSAMTFVENAASSGCDAVINYYAVGANTEQLVQLCQEYGMYYIENGGRNDANDACYQAGYDNFGGAFQADQPDTGRLFREYLLETMDASEEHSFIIATGGAYQGNAQQTEISTNMLEAIQELYGLTYDNTIEELITSASPIEATNDKGIEIYCNPGIPSAAGWLEGVSAALQTGRYDYLLLAPQALGNVGTAVSEVEEALNKDITVIGFGSFGDALNNAFNTTDKFGNTTVSMSTVKFTSLVSAMAFSEVYNMLTGYSDATKAANGEPAVLTFRMEAVTSADQLAEMSGWDTDGKWVADYDVVDSFLGMYNEGLTADQIQEKINAVTYESIRERLQ